MIESSCRADIWEKCNQVTGIEKLCWIKGKERPVWEFEEFYRGMSGYPVIWNENFHRKRGTNETFRKAVGLFSRNGKFICQAWINEEYGGDWAKAIRKHVNFDTFFNDFEKYFAYRRQQFMDRTMEIIQQLRPELKDIKPIKTNSHGGVANLLKVLTKTMNEQGSSIQSIAKVQYLICCQAGIYVADEFITDVMTAVDMIPDLAGDKS